AAAAADELPLASGVEAQPLAAQCQRVADALDYLGAPLALEDKKALEAAISAKDVKQLQTVMDKYCLAAVETLPTNKPSLRLHRGPAKPRLMQQGWRVFLVKVLNVTKDKNVELRADSPNAMPLHVRSSGSPAPKVGSTEPVPERFLDLEMFNKQPLLP